jgi:hypothetical protein
MSTVVAYCCRLYLATCCLPRIGLRGKVFIGVSPSSGSICHNTRGWDLRSCKVKLRYLINSFEFCQNFKWTYLPNSVKYHKYIVKWIRSRSNGKRVIFRITIIYILFPYIEIHRTLLLIFYFFFFSNGIGRWSLCDFNRIILTSSYGSFSISVSCGCII